MICTAQIGALVSPTAASARRTRWLAADAATNLVCTVKFQGATDHDIQASATWELAHTEVEISAWNDAKSTLRGFIKRFPDHARAADARQMLAELMMKH